MNVELVSITQPLIKTKDGDRFLTAEELISYCARISSPQNQLNVETAPRLLKYCINHGHWSIFEQSSFTVSIETSRAIAPQFLRHKSFSFQEFSQRYAEVQKFEPIELRKQGKTNRQVGDEIVNDNYWNDRIKQNQESSYLLYSDMVKAGIAKESARMVLNLNVSTNLFMSGTIRSWIHYLQLRTSPDTQKEHRLIAEEIKKIFIDNFPNISEALGWVKNLDADAPNYEKDNN